MKKLLIMYIFSINSLVLSAAHAPHLETTPEEEAAKMGMEILEAINNLGNRITQLETQRSSTPGAGPSTESKDPVITYMDFMRLKSRVAQTEWRLNDIEKNLTGRSKR